MAKTNYLGNGQAEADGSMLSRAFVETPECETLLAANDSHVVVGRRGSGKSALYLRLRAHIESLTNTISVSITPDELDIVGLKKLCRSFSDDFPMVRATSRFVWTATILAEVLGQITKHYRVKLSQLPPDVLSLNDTWQRLAGHATAGKAYELLRATLDKVPTPADLTELTHRVQTKQLKTAVLGALREARLRAVVLLDKLDEGWLPDDISTAFVAGLLNCTNDFGSQECPLRVIAFVRDNMFRAIERLDSDYSRNLEPRALRLHWDEAALFHMTCARIRAARSIRVEKDDRAWNQFVSRGLENREGFRKCLRLTLYRPRDLIGLLNDAYLAAARDNRETIIDSDVDASARAISMTRLSDLLKEYESVFPGLAVLASAFQNGPVEYTLGEAESVLEEAVTNSVQEPHFAQHAALLGTRGLLRALYGVGFFGVFEQASRQYQFCHDGRAPDDVLSGAGRRLLIHPCYQIALNCSAEPGVDGAAAQIFDEHDITVVSDQVDLRKREVGTLLAQLGTIPKGSEGFADFEKWCRRVLEVICAGHLSNFERHPTADGVNRRDVVAACVSAGGFWKRFCDSYGARQVVFEIKNYDEVKLEDVRQLRSYLYEPYGRAGFLVTRSNEENLTKPVLQWIREGWASKRELCILLPVKILTRLLSKVRQVEKHDEVGEQWSKVLDRYERNYLETPSSRVSRERA